MKRSNLGRSISILTIDAKLIGIVDPVLFVLFTLVLNLTRLLPDPRCVRRGRLCRVPAELNRRSFDFASRDEAARGSAQDGTFSLANGLI